MLLERLLGQLGRLLEGPPGRQLVRQLVTYCRYCG